MRLNQVQFGMQERLDDHQKAIVEFIRNNPHRTENQIVKAMEQSGQCSKMTTLKKLQLLIEMDEIKDLSKKDGSRFHRFIVNEKSEFNQISEKLSEFEALIHSFGKVENLVKDSKQKNPLDGESYLLFEQYCFQVINMMLLGMLAMIDKHVKSEKDAQILNTKNIVLLMKLFLIVDTGTPKRLLDMASKYLKSSVNQLYSDTGKNFKPDIADADKSDKKEVFKMHLHLMETIQKSREDYIQFLSSL